MGQSVGVWMTHLFYSSFGSAQKISLWLCPISKTLQLSAKGSQKSKFAPSSCILWLCTVKYRSIKLIIIGKRIQLSSLVKIKQINSQRACEICAKQHTAAVIRYLLQLMKRWELQMVLFIFSILGLMSSHDKYSPNGFIRQPVLLSRWRK